MKESIQSFGRYEVIRERMTDGAAVFSVQFVSDDGPLVVLACNRQNRALALAEQLHGTVIDVSLRDVPEVA